MRILLIHRYFWPDSPPYASLLREIGEYWAGCGNQVTVLSTQPSYKIEVENARRPAREKVGSLNVIRLPLLAETSRSNLIRGINSLLFALRILLHILFRGGQYDVVMCSTIPPVVTGLACATACKLRDCKFLYHAMDIWPEVAVISKQLKPGLLYRFLKAVDTWSCRNASLLICLSEDMRATFLKRSANLANNTVVLNNFELPVFDQAETKDAGEQSIEISREKFLVLFAGNIGKYQGLDSVVEAAEKVKNPNVEFLFLGDGAAKVGLIEQAKRNGTLDRNVRFLSHQPPTVAKQYMSAASVCLVTLAPGVASVAFPSKTTTILALGTPLAVMVESKSDLANMVTSNHIGITAKCGDANKLAQQIDELCNDRVKLESMREAARKYGQCHATAASVLPKWNELLASLTGESRLSQTMTSENSL